jgi:hypothetical protein
LTRSPPAAGKTVSIGVVFDFFFVVVVVVVVVVLVVTVVLVPVPAVPVAPASACFGSMTTAAANPATARTSAAMRTRRLKTLRRRS